MLDLKTRTLHGVRGNSGGTPYDSHRARGGMDKTALADAHTFGRLLMFVVMSHGPVTVSGSSE